MAYNEMLVNRVRESLVQLTGTEEKQMFGGVCFMVDGKMCIGVLKDELMCRIDPSMDAEVLEKHGCRPMDFTGRRMKGYVFVSEDAFRTTADFDYWVRLCLAFNPKAKASKKRSSVNKNR